MDFFNFLIPKEKIVGVEISERKLRMLYLKKDAYGKIRPAGASEVVLEEGVIVSGAVKNKELLSKALEKLKENFVPWKALSNFVIATIPQNGVYSEVLEFPKDLTGGQLIEAISLNAASNFPFPLTECYLDWQVIGTEGNKNKVLISLIYKKKADEYIDIFKENKFELIALEPASLSFSRAVDFPGDPLVFLYFTNDGITGVVYKDKFPYLSQYETWLELSGGKALSDIGDIAAILKKKIKSLASYFENEYENIKIKKVLLINDEASAGAIIESIGVMPIAVEEAKPSMDFNKDNSWLQAAGAAKRAFIPRGEDTIISLLPVGTESLYDTQKAISFAKSIMLFAASLSVFYLAVFTAAFILISSLEAGVDSRLEARTRMPLPVEYRKIEEETGEFNKYARDLAKIYSQTGMDHAEILKNMDKLNMAGISFTNMNFNNSTDYISVSGIALSRENLNAFKYRIDNSDLFKKIDYSVQNIAQKNNIPFNLNLHLK